jgi:hypothetical protein
MEYQVIDNFLHPKNFEFLRDEIIFNQYFPFYISESVALSKTQPGYDGNVENQNWNWFATHTVYDVIPTSDRFAKISDVFLTALGELEMVKSLMRIKINFYPNTPSIKEHASHTDYGFSHKSAVYSLNTCDGFTRMPNGDKVNSVANRIVIFDGGELHNSSTVTNVKGRFNIVLNWL